MAELCDRLRAEIAWVTLDLSELGSPTRQASVRAIRRGWAAEKDPSLKKTLDEYKDALAKKPN